MGFKDILERFGEKQRERQAMIKAMEDKARFQRIVEDRLKSSNERELERYMNEDREEFIKEKLEFARKKRDKDIKFGHNPLDTPNITNHTDWEVLKEKNQFASRGNMFAGQKTIHKSSNKLLKNNKRLYGI